MSHHPGNASLYFLGSKTFSELTLLTFLTTHANLPPYAPYVFSNQQHALGLCAFAHTICFVLFSWLHHTWDLSSSGIELVPCPLHWECGVSTTAIFFFKCQSLKLHPHSHFTNPI